MRMIPTRAWARAITSSRARRRSGTWVLGSAAQSATLTCSPLQLALANARSCAVPRAHDVGTHAEDGAIPSPCPWHVALLFEPGAFQQSQPRERAENEPMIVEECPLISRSVRHPSGRSAACRNNSSGSRFDSAHARIFGIRIRPTQGRTCREYGPGKVRPPGMELGFGLPERDESVPIFGNRGSELRRDVERIADIRQIEQADPPPDQDNGCDEPK